jgi:hypothetical protein
MLEKAFSKLYGTYERIVAGDETHAYFRLTGRPSRRVRKSDTASWSTLFNQL